MCGEVLDSWYKVTQNSIVRCTLKRDKPITFGLFVVYMWHDQGGLSRMSGILVLSYGLKEVTNSYVFIVLNFEWCSYLHNQLSDWGGVWIKMQHFKWTSDLYWKMEVEYVTQSRGMSHMPTIFNFWIIDSIFNATFDPNPISIGHMIAEIWTILWH